MRKKIRFFFGGIVLSLLMLGIWAFHLFSKQHQSTYNIHADITINAEDLYSDHIDNETDADKKYINKIIIVKGKISEISENGTNYLIFYKKNGGGINCEMAAEVKYKKIILPPDSVITIKGKCIGFLIDVNLVDCVIQ